MAKKVCKACKLMVEGSECAICHGKSFTTTWQGRLFIVDANKSGIAQKIGYKVKGEYAIKTR